MFHFNQAIINIYSFSADNNHIIYCLKSGSIYLDGIEIYKNGNGEVSGNILKNNYYIYGSPENSYLGNFRNGEIIISPKGVSPNTISDIGIVTKKNSSYYEKLNLFKNDFYYLKFESNEETVLFKEKSGAFSLNYTHLKSIFRSLNNLSLYNLQSGECYWEIDLSGRNYIVRDKDQEATIIKLIGIEAGMLIVFMSNKELISIDIETGKILWETKDFIKNNLPAYNDFRMARSIFYYGILENRKLFQLDGNIYYSLDLETQEVEILWEDKSETDYLTCQYASYTEDYVYFTGSRENRFSPYLLGAFNRKTLRLDWIHQPEGIVNPLTNVPHYVNGKLYILDSGGILHVYERAE